MGCPKLTYHQETELRIIHRRKELTINKSDLKGGNNLVFGMLMPGRQYNSGEYRFGYQGSLKDDEISGQGNSYTTHFRQLDTRLLRWWSTDPITHPWQSPYTSMDNNPILLIDPTGADGEFTYDENGKTIGYQGDVVDYEGNIKTVIGEEWTNEKLNEENLIPVPIPLFPNVNDLAEVAESDLTTEQSGDSPEFPTTQVLLTTGIGLGAGSNIMYSSDFGTWASKNGNFYSQSWGGNGSTGGKLKYAKKTSDMFKWAGRAIGGLNAANIEMQRGSGNMSNHVAVAEQTSNVVGTFAPGLFGVAHTVGWESGRTIAQTEGWLDTKFWFQKEVMGWNVTRSQMCTSCPNSGPSQWGWTK